MNIGERVGDYEIVAILGARRNGPGIQGSKRNLGPRGSDEGAAAQPEQRYGAS